MPRVGAGAHRDLRDSPCLALTARRHAESEGRDRIALRDLLAAGVALGHAGLRLLVGRRAGDRAVRAASDGGRARSRARAGGPARGSGRRVWLGIASLVRPETPLIAGALAVDRLATRGLASTARWLGVIAAIFGPFLIFRRLYFDSWLPNTYYAKTGAPRGRARRPTAGTTCGAAWPRSSPRSGTRPTSSRSSGGLLLAVLLVFAWRRRVLRSEAIVVTAVACGRRAGGRRLDGAPPVLGSGASRASRSSPPPRLLRPLGTGRRGASRRAAIARRGGGRERRRRSDRRRATAAKGFASTPKGTGTPTSRSRAT